MMSDESELGDRARELYHDANLMLERIVSDKLLTPQAVFGFYNAASNGDDILIFDEHQDNICTFHFLRQQMKKNDETPIDLLLTSVLLLRTKYLIIWVLLP